MRRNLLAQAAAENQRGFGVDLQLISMFEKHPPRVDLLIIDEAQHDGALSMANLHGCIKPKNILGLSATPFRSDRFKLCFERSIRDAGTHALIQEGYLSPYHHYTIPRYAPAEVAEAYARDRRRWGQSLIFFHTMADCRQCQRELARRGIDAELVTGKSDRERQIADFSAGRVSVMINMIILAEGFDCPSLQTVFCRPSGRLCTVQMAGRALRKHPLLPFKQVVQCAQTRYPFPRGATPAEQYLWSDADGWRSLKLNRHIEAMTRRMQSLIASSGSQLPAMLTHQAAARTRPWWRHNEPSESVA
jgi:superfamily II DNA or RNA helicase